jgi:hypothetical protein
MAIDEFLDDERDRFSRARQEFVDILSSQTNIQFTPITKQGASSAEDNIEGYLLTSPHISGRNQSGRLLDAVRKALRDCGIDAGSVSATSTGVFLAHQAIVELMHMTPRHIFTTDLKSPDTGVMSSEPSSDFSHIVSFTDATGENVNPKLAQQMVQQIFSLDALPPLHRKPTGVFKGYVEGVAVTPKQMDTLNESAQGRLGLTKFIASVQAMLAAQDITPRGP